VIGPQLAVADGALGFWEAVEQVWPKTRGQRCWVHKTANVLNKLPKSQQSKAKRALQEIWMAATKPLLSVPQVTEPNPAFSPLSGVAKLGNATGERRCR
jgi:Transposase, Mutator family